MKKENLKKVTFNLIMSRLPHKNITLPLTSVDLLPASYKMAVTISVLCLMLYFYLETLMKAPIHEKECPFPHRTHFRTWPSGTTLRYSSWTSSLAHLTCSPFSSSGEFRQI